MHLEPKTENAGNASPAEAKKLFDLADDLFVATGNLVCMCDLMESGIDDALFPGLDAQRIIEGQAGDNCFYIAGKDRRLLAFMANDCAVRAQSLDALAEQVVEAAKALHNLLKAAQSNGSAA